MTTTAQRARQQARAQNGQYSEMARGEADVNLGIGVSTQTADHSVASPGMTYAVGPFEVTYILDGRQVSADEIAERGSWDGVLIEHGAAAYAVPVFTPAFQTSRPVYGRGYDGSKSSDEYRPVAQIAKDVRADIKDAVKVGWLPENLEYRVTCGSGDSINVTVIGLSDADREDPDGVARNGPGRTDRDEVVQVERRIKDLVEAYNRSRTDSMTDYFEERFYSKVRFESEASRDFRVKEAARLKKVREAAAADRAYWNSLGRSQPSPVQRRVISFLEQTDSFTSGGMYAAAGPSVRTWQAVGELTRKVVDGGHATFVPSGSQPRTEQERQAVELLRADSGLTVAQAYTQLGVSTRRGDYELTRWTSAGGPLRVAAKPTHGHR